MHRQRLKHAAAVLAITAVVHCIVWASLSLRLPSALVAKLEFVACDALLFAVRGPLPPPPDVLIVAIDAQSVREVGAWPFPRARHAELIRRLTAWGARVIAFDVVMDLERPEAPGGDAALVAACRESGRCVMAASIEEAADKARGIAQQRKVVVPFSSLAAAADVGLVNFPTEADGVVRRAHVRRRVAGEDWPLLSVVAVARALGSDPRRLIVGRTLALGSTRVPLDAEDGFWINFAGPEGTLPRVSYHEVLDDEALRPGHGLPARVRDRIVFVGATDPLMRDDHTTPMGPGFPGVEVHASVASMLLHGYPIHRWPEGSGPVLVALFSLTIAWVGAARRPSAGALVCLGVVVAYCGAAAAAFALRGLWVPIIVPVAGSVLAWLASTLHTYLIVDRERRRVRALFSKYVSREVAHELMEDEDASQLGNSRKMPVTCLFSDIRNFTPLSERLRPEEVVAMLNEYFERMVGVVFDHRGTLDKYVGDAIMATFGVPKSFGNDAERACRAAVRMREELAVLQAKWAAEGRTGLDIGIGIHTGEAIVGNIGHQERREFTCIGDTINTASRLESLNKELGTKILISDATYAEVEPLGLFEVRKLPPVTLKGKSEPVQVYELLGWRADALQRAASEAAVTP